MASPVSRRQIIGLMEELNKDPSSPQFTLEEVAQGLASRGFDIEGVNAPMAAHGNMPRPPRPLAQTVLDVLPSSAGMAGSIYGGARGGLPGRLLGAGLGQIGGAAVQRAGYAAMGLGEPDPGEAAALMEKYVPGFEALPHTLQQGAVGLGTQGLGEGAAVAIGVPLKFAATQMGKLAVGGNVPKKLAPKVKDFFRPSKTAVDEGIPFTDRGVRKLGKIVSRESEVRDQMVRDAMRQRNIRVDVGPVILKPVLNELTDRVVKEAQIPEEAAQYIAYVAQRWGRSRANRGIQPITRVVKMTKPPSAAVRQLNARMAGKSLDPAKLAYYEGKFYETLNRHALDVMSKAVPEVAEHNARISQLMHLRPKLIKHNVEPSVKGFSHRAAPVVGGSLGGLLLPAESREDRIRNTLLGGTGGALLSNPELIQLLLRATRQVPRAAAAVADITEY